MEVRLKNFLVQSGLNLAVKPLIAVGVDAACAVEFIDDDVVQIMRSEHALPLVTAKMLKAKLPLIMEFASSAKNKIFTDDMAKAHAGGAESVEHELDEFAPDTTPHHKLVDMNDPGNFVSLRADAAGENEFDSRSRIGNAMENAGATAENEFDSRSHIGNAMENAGAAGENEFNSRSDKESACVVGEEEPDLGMAIKSRCGPAMASATADMVTGEMPDPRSDIEDAMCGPAMEDAIEDAGIVTEQVPDSRSGMEVAIEDAGIVTEQVPDSRSDIEDAMQSMVPRKKHTTRLLDTENGEYQCPKCLKFFCSSSKQTLMANKTRHVNACNGFKSISRNASGSSQSSQTDRAGKKHSFLVYKALQPEHDTEEDENEKELISYAQCLLNLSQRCGVLKKQKRGRFETPLTLRHYTTIEENECCRSIGQKFMLDAGSILELNKKRYRGFKTIDTRLKAGTDIIITAERGD